MTLALVAVIIDYIIKVRRMKCLAHFFYMSLFLIDLPYMVYNNDL